MLHNSQFDSLMTENTYRELWVVEIPFDFSDLKLKGVFLMM